METFNFLELPLKIREKILLKLDKVSVLTLSRTSKSVLLWLEKLFEQKTKQIPYFSHYLSSTFPNHSQIWRREYFQVFEYYERWYLKAFKRSPNDFNLLKEIGEGSYSVVWEAQEKLHKNSYFAIKQVAKRQLIREKKIAAIQREKEILGTISHFNIIKLFGTMVDEDHLYFIFERCINLDILISLKKVERFSLECSRFYISEIISAVSFLHSLNILHRDIKPEKPNTFAGTAQYLAPEILKDIKSASKSSDYWSIGCTLFHFICGNYPFQGKSEYLVMKSVEIGSFFFPDFITDEKAKEVINKLLISDPTERVSSFEEIIKFPFFEGVDWQNLHLKEPPKPVS